MTDKEIDVWLNRISEKGYFLLIKEISKTLTIDQQAEIFSENIDINYLEKDLGLVISLIEQNKSGHIVKLSKKGINAINKGGWIKYKSEKESKRRKEKYKKEFSYWFGIIIPFLMLLVAVWTTKNATQESINRLEDKLKEAQTQQIEKEVDIRMGTLTKRMDSVLLTIESNMINDSTLPIK